jgi:hypothetical protein
MSKRESNNVPSEGPSPAAAVFSFLKAMSGEISWTLGKMQKNVAGLGTRGQVHHRNRRIQAASGQVRQSSISAAPETVPGESLWTVDRTAPSR